MVIVLGVSGTFEIVVFLDEDLLVHERDDRIGLDIFDI